MKLKNKKTGEIVIKHLSIKGNNKIAKIYSSLAELNAEWEDAQEEPKEYWYINEFGTVTEITHTRENIYDKQRKNFGNYFETREEAEQTLEKLKAWKRLKDNGFKIKGWKFTPDMKQIEGNYVKIEAEVPQILINEKDIDLLFGGEE